MAEVDQMAAPDVESPKPDKKKPSKQKSNFKLNLIVIVVSQLILAGGGFLMVSQFIKPDPAIRNMLEEKYKQEAGIDAKGHGEGGEAHVEDTHKEIYLLEDIIVNPAGTRGSRYLSISIGVEMNAPAEEEKKGGGGHGGHGGGGEETHSPLEPKKAQLRDGLINILSSKTIVELTTVEEKEKIRQEILTKFSEILKPEPVHQIYFVDFVLQ